MAQDDYDLFAEIKCTYDKLIDTESKKIFCARLLYDLEPSYEHYKQLGYLYSHGTEKEKVSSFSALDELFTNSETVYLYGVNSLARHLYYLLLSRGIDIKGIYDRNAKKLQGTSDIPIYLPPDKPDHKVKICVTSVEYRQEIIDSLLDKGFLAKNILDFAVYFDLSHQYFDFSDYLVEKGIFVDAGCYDASTAVRFAKWSDGKYTKILAFEPDEKNAEKCINNAAKNNLRDFQLLPFGLWDKQTISSFKADHSTDSCLDEDGNETVHLISLDEVVKDEFVSFIKMDIEGAELNALKGASKIIKRDKPMCAICVYHRPGDLLSIMKYLYQLVPQYKFAIRQYSNIFCETVLYAFIDKPM